MFPTNKGGQCWHCERAAKDANKELPGCELKVWEENRAGSCHRNVNEAAVSPRAKWQNNGVTFSWGWGDNRSVSDFSRKRALVGGGMSASI